MEKQRGHRVTSSLHHPVAREWSEPHLHASNLVYPLFVSDKLDDVQIKGFEPNVQWGKGQNNQYASLISHLTELQTLGLRSIMLFGVVQGKDAIGSQAHHKETPVIVVGQLIAKHLPQLQIMFDVCLCEYTDHGHCGILRTISGDEQVIDNDSTIELLSEIALSYAKAGAHWVCPSDMLDGRIAKIRTKLDENGFAHVSIMAYTSKKASVMYAPFRDAVDSTFKGDRKRYQQPIGSINHAKQALQRDIQEGASAVIVKPALFYGDIIRMYSETSSLPIACYIVSGDYVMLRDYAIRCGDLESVLRESHLSMYRAGASILITYFTPVLLKMIKEGKI